MEQTKTLLSVRSSGGNPPYDAIKGIQISLNGDVSPAITENEFRFRRGYINIGRIPELENSAPFTLEAVVVPDKTTGSRQNILESQYPAIAFFIDNNGFLNGSVNVQTGWQVVTSTVALIAGKATHVRFSRDAQGNMVLEMDNVAVGARNIPGALVPAAERMGFRAGIFVDNNSYAFSGLMRDINILLGAYTTAAANAQQQLANQMAATIKSKMNTKATVEVVTNVNLTQSMLQPVKQIMNAAGVQNISELATLQLTQSMVIPQGTLLVARKKNQISQINWQTLANNFDTLTKEQQQMHLATYLPNRNSTAFLESALNNQPLPSPKPQPGDTPPIIPPRQDETAFSAVLADEDVTVTVQERALSGTTGIDQLLHKITTISTEDWPALSSIVNLQSAVNMPIDSSVMIAGELDLTNITLTIEPNVEKLYIIAERITCGPNATITWRRPGGSTPGRTDEPELDGLGWSGIHTKPNSKNGVDGGHAAGGGRGINGATGRNAPQLEIWVKELSSMPNIDLNGEDGIKGGTGQKGGKGGRGADGAKGKNSCFIGCWCGTQGGNGGNGGNGGPGGQGGQGGNGGNGGNLIIAVLQGTLGTVIANNTFRIKNEAGRAGRGGYGGSGGNGGSGGFNGNTSFCRNANNGQPGAAGSLGSPGPDGYQEGIDAHNQFMEFTERDWNEQLTRPFITAISPFEVFPGNSITIKGYKFLLSDRVYVDGVATPLAPVINADQSISVTLPNTIGGGQKGVSVRRGSDGIQSNRIPIWIKPQVDSVPPSLKPAAEAIITGRAFLQGAVVMYNDSAIPPTSVTATEIRFITPNVDINGHSGGDVQLAVRNPDGMVSESRKSVMPHILGIDFRFCKHNLSFRNFTDGAPSWSTFEDTFGSAEIWRELLDPVFGHPILTAAYYGFYHFFLKGEDNGGLATGFCTSMACIVADNFWQGRTDTHTLTKESLLDKLTAVHGKLLSRETLLHFHAQSNIGVGMVEKTARLIERAFLTGCDRYTMPILFFIPTGQVWDSGYIDTLADTHCIMPYRFVYPPGHPGPKLSADRSTTTTDLDGVELYCWDCNKPKSNNCKIVFSNVNGELHYQYFADSATEKFSISKGITLGNMSNGDYMLADHDLPFSGPFGLTSFIVDFLTGAADLRVTSSNGLRTGNFDNKILSEIPDSHPCYMVRGAYLLPTGRGFTKRIIGKQAGEYTYTSILPDGTTIRLENVSTEEGHQDTLYVNADTSQLLFVPQTEKEFTITFSRRVNNQMRSLAIHGMSGGPQTYVHMTVSPQLDVVRLGNTGSGKLIQVKAFVIDKDTNTPVNKRVLAEVPASHDLVLTVGDWNTAAVRCTVVPFFGGGNEY